MNIEWGPNKDSKQQPADPKAAPRILVVDDEESIRAIVPQALREAGYEVSTASSGFEALQLIDAQPPFDLFILDVMMPQMRGDELGRELRQRNADAKVLYFTGFSQVLFQDQPMLHENESFAEKPLTLAGLREAVSLLLYGHLRGPQ